MLRRSFRPALPCLTLAVTLAACGDGGGSSPPAPMPAARTLAYVVTDCHEDTHSLSGSQRLEVVRAGGAPVTVAEIPTIGGFPALGLCPLYGASRNGGTAAYADPFQRVGISPDGSGVVYEVNFKFSLWTGLGVRNPLTPEQEGIFYVRADGTGTRRLGDPSRERAQRLGGIPGPSMPSVPLYLATFFSFSPDGRTITFIDRGPGPAGEDAAQVVILDIATGARKPVTRLPMVTAPYPSNPVAPAISYSGFWDDETIGFSSRANPVDAVHPDGLNPEGNFRTFVVKTDGTGLTMLPDLVGPAALPGSHIVPVFQITQPVTNSNSNVGFLTVPGTPTNPLPPSFFPLDQPTQELFVLAPDHALQLTNFGRFDSGNATVDGDGQRVFFTASANPYGTNPSENCQLFSVSTLGGDLRQLTHFNAGDHSTIGCFNGAVDQMSDPTGCRFHGVNFDSDTQTIVFDSSCDPLGMNPSGAQIFAMRSDGTGLRQLTALRGVVTAADGKTVDVELPGPFLIVF